jgi:hypothetical protein
VTKREAKVEESWPNVIRKNLRKIGKQANGLQGRGFILGLERSSVLQVLCFVFVLEWDRWLCVSVRVG